MLKITTMDYPEFLIDAENATALLSEYQDTNNCYPNINFTALEESVYKVVQNHLKSEGIAFKGLSIIHMGSFEIGEQSRFAEHLLDEIGVEYVTYYR